MITEAVNSVTTLSSFIPCPPAAKRAAWEALPGDLKRRLVEDAASCLHYEYPVLTAVDFMDFSRTGDRNRYQNKLFERRTVLNRLILAECVEYKGRFLDDIINGIYTLCEETAWQLPAHNSYIRDTPQLILPDVSRPIIDLFAAETASILAVAGYLLKEALDSVSPFICAMIGDNLEHRIIKPYLSEHFWWMGDGQSHMNNWTVWCTQNVLLTAFVEDRFQESRMEILKKACQSIDFFLDEYGEDGCCDEGAQYYRHAGLCLFNCFEVLNAVSGQVFDFAFRVPKIRNIASYILNAHIDGPYYVNFADCSPVAGRCNAREFLFGKRTENQELMAFAAEDYRNSEYPLLTEEHNLFYRLQTVFTHEEMTAYPASHVCHRDLYYPSTGLFIARDDALYLAVKAGDNDDSHNHNDTGSFTIYKNGRPLFIDVGVETYTKKTFSPQRYEIWTMRSCYHNLPSFGEPEASGMIEQKAGPGYGASSVSWELLETMARISMDLAPAYADSRIRSYRREAVLRKGEGITILDQYDGELSQAVLSLMCYERPELHGHAISIGSLGTCRIQGAASICTETIPIEDERLKTAWSHELYRCLVTMEDRFLKLEID